MLEINGEDSNSFCESQNKQFFICCNIQQLDFCSLPITNYSYTRAHTQTTCIHFYAASNFWKIDAASELSKYWPRTRAISVG